MYCTECKKEYSEGTSFCTECGAPLIEKIPEESPVKEEVLEAPQAAEAPAESVEERIKTEILAESDLTEEFPLAENVLEEEFPPEKEELKEAPASETLAEKSPVQEVQPAAAPTQKKQSQIGKAGKIAGMFLGFLAASIALVALCLWLVPEVILPHAKYLAAGQAYHSGQYEKAVRLYSSMPGFKESRRQCSKAMYALAESSFETGDYATAVSYYSRLGDYEDSKEQLAAARSAYASELMDKGEYFLALCQLEYGVKDDPAVFRQYQTAVKLYTRQVEEAKANN